MIGQIFAGAVLRLIVPSVKIVKQASFRLSYVPISATKSAHLKSKRELAQFPVGIVSRSAKRGKSTETSSGLRMLSSEKASQIISKFGRLPFSGSIRSLRSSISTRIFHQAPSLPSHLSRSPVLNWNKTRGKIAPQRTLLTKISTKTSSMLPIREFLAVFMPLLLFWVSAKEGWDHKRRFIEGNSIEMVSLSL